MGREACVIKERVCQECRGVMYSNAYKVKEHYCLCRRLANIGLASVDLVVAPNLIIKP
mgnify:FL=1